MEISTSKKTIGGRGGGFVAPTTLAHTLCYPQGHPCKVPAFAQRTHFSCDICESKTNFRSGDSGEKPLKGLVVIVVLLFDLSLSLSLSLCAGRAQCSLHICHCFFRLCFRFLLLLSPPSSLLLLQLLLSSKSLRQYAAAKKKRKNLKLCSAFFECFINKSPGAFYSSPLYKGALCMFT